jgi:hypothetical protein
MSRFATAAALIGGGPFPQDPTPFVSYALQFVGALQDAATNLNPPQIAVSQIQTPPVPQFYNVNRPTLQPITFSLPPIPTEFTGQLNVDGLLPAPFDASPPTLVLGAVPTAEFDPLPTAPGVDLSFVMPELDLSLPTAPELLSISVSTFNGISLPAPPGPGDEPVLNIVAPTIREYVPGTQYSSALLTALEGELLRRITDGGTMLNPAVEGAIWDRGREREAETLRVKLDDLERMESLGYALPSGVWLDARLKIQTEHAAASRGLSREIMVEQAKLELEGVRQALEIAQRVEAQNMQIANQIEQRAFEAARYATEAGVAIYNARVQAFGAFVDVYRAKVQAYEARIRGELARVEAYKLEIDAERLKVQVNQSRVEQFKVLTDAALAAIEVYKAEIGGIQARAEIEKLRVQIFGEQVRGYSAQVNAYTASVEAFRAATQAEVARQEVYRSTVQAYSARVDAGGKLVNARVTEFEARARAKENEWRAYQARAGAESDRVRALAGINEAVARVYAAEAGAAASYNEVLARQWQAATQLSINLANVSLEQAKANAQLYMLQQSMIMDAAKVGATVSAQMGAAALSANSFSTSFSNSRSVSANMSETYSTSTSKSESKSDSYSRSFSEVKSLNV